MIDRFGLLPDPIKNLFGVTEIKLKAKPLGIKKIDAGPNGGRIIFATHENIDPMIVIKMIQSSPNKYKLEGEYKLRFTANMESMEARFEEVHRILHTLSGK
jgi:transcription-repair coupling factor (superfamily II helicase)